MAAWSDASVGDLRPPAAAAGSPGAPGAPGEQDALAGWALEVTGRGAVGDDVLRQVHWAEQVHGASVITVRADAGAYAGGMPSVCDGPADALVSTIPSVALAILTADCASVALGSPEGVFGAVHCGWRGLIGGVLEKAVGAMRALGATDVTGALGPCIHAGCYEFSEPDLAVVRDAMGEAVVGRTAGGRAALDIPAAVSAAMAASHVVEVGGVHACTACAGGYFSHRARRDRGRQALLVWSDTSR